MSVHQLVQSVEFSGYSVLRRLAGGLTSTKQKLNQRFCFSFVYRTCAPPNTIVNTSYANNRTCSEISNGVIFSLLAYRLLYKYHLWACGVRVENENGNDDLSLA